MPNDQAHTSVILADEQVLYVEGLRLMLHSADTGLNVVAAVHNGLELMEVAATQQPSLIFLNVKLPLRDGLHLIGELKENCPDSRVVVLSEYDQSKFIKQAFLNGADGYMLKNSSMNELFQCVQDVMDGKTFMGEGVSIGPLHRGPEQRYDHDWDTEDAFLIKSNLTKRELEVLTCITDDKNNKEIAEELFISDQTVGVHRKNIMKKLNVRSAASLIKAAQDIGLVSLKV